MPHHIVAVNAVEASRGFEPPMFLGFRIRRNIRARASSAMLSRSCWGRKRANDSDQAYTNSEEG